MADDEFFWKRTWQAARAKQAADAPRRASIREAVDAVRVLDLGSDADVRAALAGELGRRDIAVGDPTLDALVPIARTTSTGAPMIAGLQIAKHLWGAVNTFRDLADPRWIQTPNGIPDISQWRDDQAEVAADVTWTSAAERAVAKRLFADVRAQRDEDDQPVRLLSCWLSLDGGAVRVHIGKETVGTIDVPSARTVIEHHGGNGRAVGTFAELRGDRIATATLTVFLPDRP